MSGDRIILDSFRNIEQRYTHENIQRAVNAINEDLHKLSVFCSDWATWDDTYYFVQDNNRAYIKSNLTDSNFIENNLNLIAYINTSGKIVYGQVLDRISKTQAPIPPSLGKHLAAGSVFLSPMTGELKPVSGLLLLPDGPFHITSQAILDSNSKGPAHGVLVMGRYLDQDYITELGSRTRLNMSMHVINHIGMPEDVTKAMQTITRSGADYVIDTPSEEYINSYTAVRDIDSTPAFILKLVGARDIYLQGLHTLDYLIVSISIALALLGATIIFLLQRTVIGRLSSLSREAELIRETGNYDAKLHYSGNDEISSVTQRINDLLGALNEARSSMKKQKEQAEDANQTKSQFLARMSHELRTPLNSILGFAQLLSDVDEKPGEEQILMYSNEILQSGEHLLKLVNDILDLSKIEAKKIDLVMEPVAIRDLVQECLHIVQPLADQRTILLQIGDNTDSDITVTADSFRLKQVLLNLLSNAIKYNKDGGSVTVITNSTDEERASISIIDTGPGIEQKDLAIIFEPFSRLYLDTYAQQGTGIGLSISKQLIELMNGTITVESTVGRGSTFRVELGTIVHGHFLQPNFAQTGS